MNRVFFVSFVLLLFNGNIQAQDTQYIDSVQRKLMKDSLQINDTMINQVFAVRDTMYVQINAVRIDTTILTEEKNIQISLIRNNTNSSIMQIMGEEKYQQYTEMIRRWLSRRNSPSSEPLAGSN